MRSCGHIEGGRSELWVEGLPEEFLHFKTGGLKVEREIICQH